MPDAVDVAVRQQAYIEGVKNYAAGAMNSTAEALSQLMASLLVKWRYAKISDMPKRVLRAFLSEFNRRAGKLLERFRKGFLAELKQIAKVDAMVTAVNLAYLTGKPAPSPRTAATWAKIANDPIPATGHLPGELLRDFTRSVTFQIGKLVKMAYANKMTPAALLVALNGTRERKFKDGLLRKLLNQWNTVQSTLIQHVHQWLNYNLGRLFYDYYQWVSVLDSQTTETCRSRHNNVYRYGDGPRPPAHYNCRSTIVGLAGVEARPTSSYHAWLLVQPTEVQNDLLKRTRAQKLRAGKLSASDIPRFDGTRKLTPKQFGERQPMMIKD